MKQAKKMEDAKLTTVIINSDTVEMARKENRSLFSEACTHKAMVLVSPELLKSKGFQQVLDNTQFQNCILFMAVDKAHLLNSWGKTFQKAFEQIR